MFAPLNTYITKTKGKALPCGLLVIMATMLCNVVPAQGKFSIKPLTKTDNRRFQYDLFVYAAGGWNTSSAMMLSIYNTNLYNKGIFTDAANAKIGLNGYLNYKSYLGAGFDVGLTHERFSHDKGLFGNNGIYTGWLNADLSFTLLCVSAGINFDFFLGSRTVNKDNFSYEGLPSQCFNKFSCSTYVSLVSSFRKFKLEIRYTSYLIPHINADKVAYYNFMKSYVRTSYLELRVYFRIFTSGNRMTAPERFLTLEGQSI